MCVRVCVQTLCGTGCCTKKTKYRDVVKRNLDPVNLSPSLSAARNKF